MRQSEFIATLNPGDYVYRYLWRGNTRRELLKVVRVSSKTVTATTERGKTIRIPHAKVAGRADGTLR